MTTTHQPYNPIGLAARLVAQMFGLVVILAALLFVPAGRLDWPQAWVFVIVFGLFLLFYAIWGAFRDPEQVQERSRVASNVKNWEKVIIGLYTALLPVFLIVAALDAGRFRWSTVPAALQAIGWAGMALAGGLVYWTVATNTYLSRLARIQADRGQTVITSGPYQYVRHPMYLGIIVLFLGLPLALGSFYALIPGLLIGILFVARTAKEDVMLQEELAGYAEYAKQVRWRIVPGLF
jgi:protein-S-isoprenylcysteine O-methyltransferase Ste14